MSISGDKALGGDEDAGEVKEAAFEGLAGDGGGGGGEAPCVSIGGSGSDFRRGAEPRRLAPSISSNQKKSIHGEFCWLSQEDVIRFLLGSISSFIPLPALSVSSLAIVDPDVLTVDYHDLSAPPPPSPSTTKPP
ncbi:CBS domain-containing protein CBSX5 [Acorus calamus]|uniref:CBS domain-containing protein CBSX5 n=1 Tax=Acorus calamus TaxID=4465 RepID=A0AAV9ENJ6_ACOCL|nr:CBS domain-containing protein CBSX5 [Acorus calamus]